MCLICLVRVSNSVGNMGFGGIQAAAAVAGRAAAAAYGSQQQQAALNSFHSVFGGSGGDNSTPPLLDMSEFPSLTNRGGGGPAGGGAGGGSTGGSAGQGDSLPQPSPMPGKQPYGESSLYLLYSLLHYYWLSIQQQKHKQSIKLESYA